MDPTWPALLSLWILTIINGAQQLTLGAETCQWETFNATCQQDEVVLMTSALYGRMELGRCLTSDFYIGCYNDILPSLDTRCSGRHHCTISIPDPNLHTRQPCPKDLMVYLQAEYTCAKVSFPSDEVCSSDSHLLVEGTTGYLANIITETHGYGSVTCPWVIRVLPGQVIKLTLYDFTLIGRPGDHRPIQDNKYCQVYANIREPALPRESAVCGGVHREQIVYISKGNEISVIITGLSSPNKDIHFLLKYEGLFTWTSM